MDKGMAFARQVTEVFDDLASRASKRKGSLADATNP